MATTYSRAANPIWFFNDLVGLPLNDEYYAFFLQNTFPYLPQPVYADVNGTVWNNPLEFSSAGNLPENLYFNDDLVYRIEIRHGNTQADPLIWEINNFVPNSDGSGLASSSLAPDNQISNSQFAFINFQSPFTTTVAGTYQIAPGWNLVLTGAGICTITRKILVADQNQINNPPYALRIDTNGWTTAQLIQTFEGNGALWASTTDQLGVVSMSVTARASGAPYLLSLIYAPSDGTSTTIATGSVGTGAYEVLDGSAFLPISNNTQLNDVASVSMVINLQGTGIVDISNIQVIGYSVPVGTTLPDAIAYQQEKISQEQNSAGLIAKPIKSYLVGWDFPLNPNQFNSAIIAAIASGANKSFYIWDQTILFQSVTSAIEITKNTANSCLALTSNAASRLAIIQYLGTIEARKLLSNKLSVNISIKANTAESLTATISLWYTKDGSLPVVSSPTLNSLVATLDANGKPATFNGNWIEVPRANQVPATFNISDNATTEFNEYGFSGWDMTGDADVEAANFFAIVLGFAEVPINHDIFINSVSLAPGDIPTAPAPQTLDEVIRECQFYYEKSYDNSVVPGAVSSDGSVVVPQGLIYNATAYDAYSTAFYVPFSSVKRADPAVTIYSPSAGTASRVDAHIYANGASAANASAVVVLGTYWAASGAQVSTKGFNFVTNSATPLVSSIAMAATVPASSVGQFQYSADARLGVV